MLLISVLSDILYILEDVLNYPKGKVHLASGDLLNLKTTFLDFHSCMDDKHKPSHTLSLVESWVLIKVKQVKYSCFALN